LEKVGVLREIVRMKEKAPMAMMIMATRRSVLEWGTTSPYPTVAIVVMAKCMAATYWSMTARDLKSCPPARHAIS
jgi:flagellar biosynthesis component FlhA